MQSVRFVIRALAIFAVSFTLAAQQASDAIEFEAVSVKPADALTPQHMAQSTAGGYRGRGIRLFELIMGAWHLNRGQIVGGPNWLETAGWDIDARAPAGASPAQDAK